MEQRISDERLMEILASGDPIVIDAIVHAQICCDLRDARATIARSEAAITYLKSRIAELEEKHEGGSGVYGERGSV